MKRKLTALCLCAIFIVMTFSACSDSPKVALNISGKSITSGVYSYFIDSAAGNINEADFSTEDEYTEKIKSVAVEEIKKYASVETLFSELELSLSYGAKADIASTTDNRWDLFGNHYSRVGVTKQDIGKIITNEAKKSALLTYYYGADNGVEPTKESDLKKAFEQKYIGVNIIAASLTTTDNLGNTVKLNSHELSLLRANFESMKKSANSGKSIDEIYESYNAGADLIGTESLETYVFTSSVTEYGENFFKLISGLSYNKAAVTEYEDTIYLIYRIDIRGEEAGYYMNVRNELLESLCIGKLNNIINDEAKNLSVTKEHTFTTRKALKLVLSEHPFTQKETEKAPDTTSKAKQDTTAEAKQATTAKNSQKNK